METEFDEDFEEPKKAPIFHCCRRTKEEGTVAVEMFEDELGRYSVVVDGEWQGFGRRFFEASRYYGRWVVILFNNRPCIHILHELPRKHRPKAQQLKLEL